MLERFKNVKLRDLLIHLIVSLAYPVVRAVTASGSKLLVFTDSLLIIALMLLLFGVIFSMYLHGDFDKSAFLFKRGIDRNAPPSYEKYMEDKNKEREDAFNYPLFLGIAYLVVVLILSYGVL